MYPIILWISSPDHHCSNTLDEDREPEPFPSTSYRPMSPLPLPLLTPASRAHLPPSLSERDTIYALVTPPGRGGIGVIRISGSMCGLQCLFRLFDSLAQTRPGYSSGAWSFILKLGKS
ncbi:hypothetical protein BS47DRAFT_742727 [Hydnum rufescens UP504]|uniref:GTP-binding protein TrmE N-terminal domain-containing protein n=1 Tax=Hydnum rufescens UP504 TaxID=1448309 RepID=A0A9P6B126_9AGAM|nr:hypothetical protein BS47DRAFT_742727 [Hydnum rufescens UP504]